MRTDGHSREGGNPFLNLNKNIPQKRILDTRLRGNDVGKCETEGY